MTPTSRHDVERRRADAASSARRVAEALGDPGAIAAQARLADDPRDLAEMQHDALLERIVRLTRVVAALADGDPSEPLATRLLLADLALVTTSFRRRVATAAAALAATGEHLGEVRQAVDRAGARVDEAPAS